LTLRTLADISGAIGCKVQVNLLPENKCGVARIDDWNIAPRPGAEALASSTDELDLQALVG